MHSHPAPTMHFVDILVWVGEDRNRVQIVPFWSCRTLLQALLSQKSVMKSWMNGWNGLRWDVEVWPLLTHCEKGGNHKTAKTVWFLWALTVLGTWSIWICLILISSSTICNTCPTHTPTGFSATLYFVVCLKERLSKTHAKHQTV